MMSVVLVLCKYILIVVVEDYFQVVGVCEVVDELQWYCFEMCVEKNMERIFEFFDLLNQIVMFFVLGWIVEYCLEVVCVIVDCGYEVVIKGQMYCSLVEIDVGQFWEGFQCSWEFLVRVFGQRVFGYWIGNGWFGVDDFWVFDIFVLEGFVYDLSFRFLGCSYVWVCLECFVYLWLIDVGEFWEFLIFIWMVLGVLFLILGGNYQRQFLWLFVCWFVVDWYFCYCFFYVMYFYVWDFDFELLWFVGILFLQCLCQYWNFEIMGDCICEFFEIYFFQLIVEYLGFDLVLFMGERLVFDFEFEIWEFELFLVFVDQWFCVLVVVLCYDEEVSLLYFKRILESVEVWLIFCYSFEFLFVDDGSQD